MKKIVLLKIVYNDGSSLKLDGEEAAQMVRIIDGLIDRGFHGQRVGGDAVPSLERVVSGHASRRVLQQPGALPADTGPDQT
jgi:hypothetical protein